MSKNKKSLSLHDKIPAVSVIMPVFNSEKFLPAAIESILNQNFSDFEFIIINDGSTDRSLKEIKSYGLKDKRIRIINNTFNLGICSCLNRGLSLARGKYIVRMDSDDWSYPDRINKQLSFMESRPDVVICGGAIKVCDAKLKTTNPRRYPTSDREIRGKILRINPFAHPAVMYRKETAIKAGGYNEKLTTVEDYDLYFRLGNMGQFANLTSPVLKLRIRYDSISYSNVGRQTLLHMYVRLKGVAEYGYRMNLMDAVFFIAGILGVIIIPAKHKFKLYNALRAKVI